jgi:uncharacterized membrane protein YcaP (DUF421 family)
MDEVTLLTGGGEALIRIVVVGTLGYVWLVVLLRSTGPRNLAKMTPFDFVLTVTLGSAFGRVLTAQEVGILDAVVAFSLLVGLQWLLAALRSRSSRFAFLVDVEASLLYHRGQVLTAGLRRHRLTESDLASAVREHGLGSLAEAEAVILQSDGQFAVITPAAAGDGSAIPSRPKTRG